MSTSSPTAIAPTSRSPPSTVRMRKSPRSKSILCSSMTRPRWMPRCASALLVVEALEQLDEALERRTPGELVDDPPVALRHGHRRTDRAATLRDDGRQRVDRREERTDGAIGVLLAVEHQPVAAGAAGGRRQPADDAEPGIRLGCSFEEAVDRHRERIGEEQRALLRVADELVVETGDGDADRRAHAASRRTGVGVPPTVPAQSETAGLLPRPRGRARAPDTAVTPSRRGLQHRSHRGGDVSSAPACGAVTNRTARSGAAPTSSSTWPMTFARRGVASGCSGQRRGERYALIRRPVP